MPLPPLPKCEQFATLAAVAFAGKPVGWVLSIHNLPGASLPRCPSLHHREHAICYRFLKTVRVLFD